MGDAADTIAAGCLAMRARVLARLVTKIYDDALRPFGLKAAQLNLLVGIAKAGPVPPGELASWFELDKSSMSRNVARLVQQGWVHVLDEDGRSQTLTLTRSGHGLLKRVLPAWEQAQEQAAQRLERRTLEGLRKVRA